MTEYCQCGARADYDGKCSFCHAEPVHGHYTVGCVRCGTLDVDDGEVCEVCLALEAHEQGDEPDEPDYNDGLRTWQTYDLYVGEGRIYGYTSTNDDADSGYPSSYSSWEVTARSPKEAAQRFGVCRTGFGGCEVTVYLSGEKVTRKEQYQEQWDQVQTSLVEMAAESAVGA